MLMNDRHRQKWTLWRCCFTWWRRAPDLVRI